MHSDYREGCCEVAEKTKSPFKETVARAASIGLLPHLLVCQINVWGLNVAHEEIITSVTTCSTQYYCGL